MNFLKSIYNIRKRVPLFTEKSSSVDDQMLRKYDHNSITFYKYVLAVQVLSFPVSNFAP